MAERIVHTCEQGKPEWYACRLGIPTASMFKTVLAEGRGGGESKTRRDYMLKLAGEIITGEPMENYSNAAMERGKAMEDSARSRYLFQHPERRLERVGFIELRNSEGPVAGCSPDSLVGDDGALEIKTKAPHLLIGLIERAPEFLAEHKAQCQGQLWVSDREWLDLAVYYDGLPLVTKRCTRDEPYIRALAAAVDAFNEELHQLVEKVQQYV